MKFTCSRSRIFNHFFPTDCAFLIRVRLVSSRDILIGSRELFFNRLVSSRHILAGNRGLFNQDVFTGSWGLHFGSIFTRGLHPGSILTRERVLRPLFCRLLFSSRCRWLRGLGLPGGIYILRFSARKKMKTIKTKPERFSTKGWL